ncbi:MAG: LysM peptidoglycan-binding domain-containing protein [Desulfobacterales bacterium]
MKQHHLLLSAALFLFIVSGCGKPAYKSGSLENTPAMPSISMEEPEHQQLDAGKTEAVDVCPENPNAAASEDETPPPLQPILDEALDFCQLSQDYWQKGELEAAIEALDQAYALVLTVDTEAFPKHIRQKEDLRFMISKRILEIYASRFIVVNGNHNEIPLILNKHVQAEIDLFTGREKNFFLQSYKRSGRYREKILADLKAAGIPEELAWLPLIESGFKVRALSRARALGLWQFIPSTGYKFGLNRNTYIDERLDPEKSTRAAINYLKELHQMFGDWATVLAAYNCGEGRVLQVIRDQNINYLDNFWDLYERLPRETARYVPRFLATLHIISDPEKYNMDLPEPDPALDYEKVDVSRQMNLNDIAKKIGCSEQDLKDLNPELRYGVVPDELYTLRVPTDLGKILLAGIDGIPVSGPPGPDYVLHRVRPGETLSTIARRYRTSVRRIMYANHLRSSHYIVVGQRLKIPSRGYVPPAATAARPATYKVKGGDSLWIIAKRFGTTTKEIQNANHLTTTRLSIGQMLKIPGDAVSSSGHKQVYIVRKGDSPYLIARKYKMTLSRLLSINRLTPRCKIYPGQRLYVE